MTWQDLRVTSEIQNRKTDHLDLCATDEVAFRGRTTLLECVKLVHHALPDRHLDEVDLSTTLLGKTLKAPIIIAGMTGGTERAAEINRGLATIAEKRGYGFGLGSQRAMEQKPETAWTYQVREWAPTTLLLGNVGVVQARDYSTDVIANLAKQVGADAMCIHMNPAMELIQPGGDRDFRGGVDTFRRLVKELPVPVVAKETGNGVSAEVARQLRDAGVRTVDVSGSGGTSWVGVETLRATGAAKELGELLWDWGIPTAASVHWVSHEGMDTIATGGIRNGVDIARAIALGATAGGIARLAFQAFNEGGQPGAEKFFDAVEQQLRAVTLLAGAGSMSELRAAPRIIGGELRQWLNLEP